MSKGISQQQLEAYLWGAATLLRGTIDAGDYKQFIFPLLFYKRLCDVFDEEMQSALKESGGDVEFAQYPENHRFQVPPDAHWAKVRHTGSNVGRAIQEGMRAIETANPDKLFGIFGDAQWTNKDRLSDAMLRDLVEHFSALQLTLANLPEDELGQGYEYLIKKFADDAGHTAAEFYTNRTVVHLMTEMLEPKPGDSIYDPTCGSGGMLLSCITHLRLQGKEWRNVRLYGQERNLMTSSIARMNCFLHGIEDFRIERGDTLSSPKFMDGDRLMLFDVALANPPYSIKQWDRRAFASDPWGRNLHGTPPQGRADYAFWQHILCSLKPRTGRCAILFPHGILFRQEEAEMRRKLIETDLIECIIGLGPNLFYNAAMEACVVVCRTAKPKVRKGRILFINAVNEVTRERTQSFLANTHIEHIASAYRNFKDEPGFANVAALEQVRNNAYSLKIDLYVATPSGNSGKAINAGLQDGFAELLSVVTKWSEARTLVRDALSALLPDIKKMALPATLRLVGVEDIRKRFDRTEWTRVRFGDVVKCFKETVDPNSGELERYIAGDHMDTDDVHIHRWGVVGDGYLGPAFIRRFRKNQVLYGSRRTYLKKVGYAEFDGITANTTLVLEALEGRFHQPLLPWLMLSRRFTEHSVRESKGSTNPYINYPDIAKFEFDLPPLDQQQTLAQMLWSVDEADEGIGHILQSLASSLDALVGSFTNSSAAARWPATRLIDSFEIVSGQVDPMQEPYRSMPLIAPNHIEQGSGQLLEVVSAAEQHAISGKYLFEPGDVVYSKIRPNLRKAFVATFRGLCSADMYPLRPKPDKISARYLLALLLGADFTRFAVSRCVRTGIPKLNRSELAEYVTPLPDIGEQQTISSKLDNLDRALLAVRQHRNCVHGVKAALSSELFL